LQTKRRTNTGEAESSNTLKASTHEALATLFCPQKAECEKFSGSGYLMVTTGGWRADPQQASPEPTEA